MRRDFSSVSSVDLHDVVATAGGTVLFSADRLFIAGGATTVLLLPAGIARTSLAHYLLDLPPWNTSVSVTSPPEATSRSFRSGVLVSQNYYRYTTESRVLDQLTMRAENERIAQADATERAVSAAQQLGIEKLLQRNPITLSGGEIQRMAIASALVTNPDFLVLDEPFFELDIDALRALDRVLLDLLPASGIGTCVITSMVTTLLLQHAHTYWFSDRRTLEPAGDINWRARSPAIYVKEEDQPLAEPLALAPSGTGSTRPMFEIRNLTFTYAGARKPSLRNVTIDIGRGQRIAIRGANGAGKSTLLGLLLGFEQAPEKTFIVEGQSPTRDAMRHLRARTGYLQQTYHHQFIGATPREELELALNTRSARRMSFALGALEPPTIEELATILDLFPLLDAVIDTLSIQRRRLLACAAAVLEAVDLLVMDEPTAGLDAVGRQRLFDLLTRLNAFALCVITVTHDWAFATAIADLELMLDEGAITQLRPIAGSEWRAP